MKKNTMITDWLDKYGDPEIDKKVEIELMNIMREQLKKEHTQELQDYFNELQEKHKKEDDEKNTLG
jgi:hypothetical protein